VRSELALIVLVAAFLVATIQLLERPAPQRAMVRVSGRRRPSERKPEGEAGSGLAGKVACAGMAVATLGFLGQLLAPAAEALWLVLIAGAFVSLPAALAAPWVEARLHAKARRRRSRAEWS
jgi:hypothetical protein